MMLRRSLAFLSLTTLLLARPAFAQLPQGITEEDLQQAFHLLSPTQEYGYPRGSVLETDLRLPDAMRKAPMVAPESLRMLWLPIYHDYTRSSAAVCSFSTSSVSGQPSHL